MSTALVIRCFNEEAHIGRLLTGVDHQSTQPDEIVVVDSGSTDATLEIAAKFPRVRIVRISAEEFSFGRSLNLGVEVTSAELVAVASAHVYPLATNWLEELLSPFASPEVSYVYGRQVGDHRTRFSEQRIFDRWFPAHSEADQVHPFANNANSALRRRWWTENRFDEDLTGLEDIDLARRALVAGFRVAYAAGAVVAHVHEERNRDVYRRYRREAIAFKSIFPDLRLGIGEVLGLFCGNVAGDIVAAMRAGRVPGVVADVVSFRALQFAGTLAGHRQRGTPVPALRRRLYYPAAPRAVSVELGGELIDYARRGTDRRA